MIAGFYATAKVAARRALLALVLGAVALPTTADAASRLCRQLEDQLSNLPRGGSAGSAARYDSAIARQKEQMQRVRQQARRAGCGMAILRSSVAMCAELNAAAARMEKNLVSLQGKRSGMGGGDTRRERARINAALAVNGCRDTRDDERVEEARATIDGRGTLRIGALKGTFRTMCVRTCDGYFFPISYSVSSAAFTRDEMACRAACPGTQVELYHHRVPGEESNAMVSASTGLAYTELPTAFAYKSGDASVAPACGCQPSTAGVGGERGFQIIGGDYGGQRPEDEATTAAIPQPTDRPDPAEDPETLMTREGGLDAAGLERIARAPKRRAEAETDSDTEREIRVVGPTFLPDPEEAIDLRVQDQPRAR